MPDIWTLGGNNKEEKRNAEVQEEEKDKTASNDDGSTSPEASGLYRAIDLLLPHKPADEIMGLVRAHLDEKSKAKADAIDEPVDAKGAAEEKGEAIDEPVDAKGAVEEKGEVTKPVASLDLVFNPLVKPPAASNAAAVNQRDIEMGKLKKDQVEEEGDNENEGGSEEAPSVSQSEGDLAAKSTLNQKGINLAWLEWFNKLQKTMKGPNSEKEKMVAEKALEAISAIVVDAVGPAVAEQEDSYNKFGTMVSCCVLRSGSPKKCARCLKLRYNQTC